MPLSKPKKELKVAILLPAYKRPEYTKRCLKALNEAQIYNGVVIEHAGEDGLRNAIIDFFYLVNRGDFDIIAKIDADCLVPKNWLNDIIDIFEYHDVDILSPNVFPSDAAHKYGKKVDGLPYMPTHLVGGLWVMKAKLIKDMIFQRHETSGLTGAVAILRQIINEKEPKIGWVLGVVVQDLGHWTGNHPDHIPSEEHRLYSVEVGREVAW